jgi:hypothetical protein
LVSFGKRRMTEFKAILKKWPDAAGKRAVRGGDRSAPQGEQPWTRPELTTFPDPIGERRCCG